MYIYIYIYIYIPLSLCTGTSVATSRRALALARRVAATRSGGASGLEEPLAERKVCKGSRMAVL